MTEDRFLQIENRLGRVEQLVASFEARLRRLENPSATPAPAPAPIPAAPPVVRFELPSVQARPSAPTPAASPTPPSPPKPPAAPDAEYRIGAQILPRVGALVLLLGVGFLVSLGLNSGWITPAMLFGGAVTLCLAFVGIGQWKREEREEFGQILTGIGSCGLYLTFTGGHVFQKLFSGETLVALFLLLSFANLGYSAWRASRSFLAIGLIGGLAAALMPLDQHNFTLNLSLHFAILLPSAWIAARNKWMDAAAWLWAASSLALLPVFLTDRLDWLPRVIAIDVSTLVCVAVYSYAFRAGKFDPHNLASIVFVFLTACVTYEIQGWHLGVYHLVALALATVGIAWAFKFHTVQGRSLLLAAWSAALIVAPLGFGLAAAAMIYAGSTLVHALFAGRFRKPAVVVLSGVQLAAATIAYLAAMAERPLTVPLELTLLTGLSVATCLVAWAGNRTGGNARLLTVVGGVLLAPLLTRFFWSLLVLPAFGMNESFAVAFAVGMISACALVLAVTNDWVEGTAFSLVLGACALAWYAVNLPFSLIARGHELLFLSLFIALSVGLAATSRKGGSSNGIIGVAAAIVGLLSLRIGILTYSSQSSGSASIPAVVTLGLFTLVASALAKWRGWTSVYLVSGIAWLGAACVYVSRVIVVGFGFSVELVLLGVLLASLVGFVVFAKDNADSPETLPSAAALFGWGLCSRLLYLGLTQGGVGMQPQAAISLSWIVYAAILIGIGFALNLRGVRYVALTIVGCTVGKVLLVDLAAASPGIRVGVLMTLGVAMLGGGYWYIQKKQAIK